MGLWDNVSNKDMNDARSTKGGVYFKPGNYVVRVLRCKELVTRAKDEAFIAECEVLDSDNPECPVGQRPALYIEKNDAYPTLWLGNVMDFVRAGMSSMAVQAGDEAPEKIELTKEIAEAVTGEENLLAGVILLVHAYNTVTKGKGANFTRFEWTVPDKAAIDEYQG